MHRTLPANLLFVTAENGTIPIYDLTNPGPGPVYTITGLKYSQGQMVADKSGNLFVVNNGSFENDDYVSEFAPPYNSAPTILQTVWQGQTFYPLGITVDANGTVYVTNCGAYCSETPAIFVYPKGSLVPTQAITSPKFNSLAQLALDKQGNVYVVGWNATTFGTDVFVVQAGSTTPKPLGLEGLYSGSGVTLDAVGNLYVTTFSGLPMYILEF
jgi:streptogramin lyase